MGVTYIFYLKGFKPKKEKGASLETTRYSLIYSSNLLFDWFSKL
jgi:hypothetical protein